MQATPWRLEVSGLPLHVTWRGTAQRPRIGWLVGLMVGACRFASRAVRRYAGSEVKCDLSCGRHTATPHSNSVPVVAFGAIVVVLAAAVC